MRPDMCEDCRLAEIDKDDFEDFKISPIWKRFQHAAVDMTTTSPPGLGSNYSNS